VAVKVVHVSDLSDRQGSEDELGSLVVLEHPEIGEPARLEVFPDEIEGLQSAQRIVRLEWTPPGAHKPQMLSVTQEQFDALAEGGDMRSILLQAITSEHERRGRAEAPAGRRRRGGGSRARGKVDYGTLEHAGEPHRGRITEAEKQIVRENLDEVNRRLREQGMRTIDPADPDMQKRYGLSETAA
jgi:hypothetical protein